MVRTGDSAATCLIRAEPQSQPGTHELNLGKPDDKAVAVNASALRDSQETNEQPMLGEAQRPSG